jgi:hypothetical protein
MTQNFLAIEPTDKSNPRIAPLDPYDGEADGQLIAGESASRPLGWKMLPFDKGTTLGDIADLYRPAAAAEFDRGGEKDGGPAGTPIRVTLCLLPVRKLFVVA